MEALIVLVGNSAGFETLRIDAEHTEVFRSFVNYCLVHFCSLMNWWYKAYTTVVSDTFVESDKVFVILLLEINVNDYKIIMEEERKLTKKPN